MHLSTTSNDLKTQLMISKSKFTYKKKHETDLFLHSVHYTEHNSDSPYHLSRFFALLSHLHFVSFVRHSLHRFHYSPPSLFSPTALFHFLGRPSVYLHYWKETPTRVLKSRRFFFSSLRLVSRWLPPMENISIAR